MTRRPRRAAGAATSEPLNSMPSSDSTGLDITLSETGGVRYLHFGTDWIQGAMRIARPFALQLDYQRQMMAPLLFQPEPTAVLQLGLGAAAMTKFVYRFLPNSTVTAVELAPAVVSTAHRSFALPPSDKRLIIEIDDARAYVERRSSRGSAQWLQVDLYDAKARGPVHDDFAFYAACRACLRAPAVASFNLFGRAWRPSFAAIAEAFGGRALLLPEADAGNRIALAFVGPPLAVSFEMLYQLARAIEDRLDLPARKWVSGLRVADVPAQGNVRIDADWLQV